MKVTVKVVGRDQSRSAQGIHLLNPDRYEIRKAKEDAKRDGFKTIYAHFDNITLVNFKKERERRPYRGDLLKRNTDRFAWLDQVGSDV